MALGSSKHAHSESVQMFASCTTFQNSTLSLSKTVCAPYTQVSSKGVSSSSTTLESNNAAIIRRNARERNRVKQVNNGFLNLRQHIPTAVIADLSNGRRGIGPGANKKLSKVDTLRMAVEYIRRLKRVIQDVDSASESSSVSSFDISDSSTSCCSSPTITATGNYFEQQKYLPANFSGSYQTYTQAKIMISEYASNFTEFANPAHKQNNHRPYEDCSNSSADDEDILDYISLWQDEM